LDTDDQVAEGAGSTFIDTNRSKVIRIPSTGDEGGFSWEREGREEESREEEREEEGFHGE